MTVEELVLAAQQGNDEAFFQLISAEKERLYKIAFAYLKNESESLEAIQETTCRAYVKLRKMKEPRYFNTWLIRILIHYCIDEQKRKRKVVILLEVPETKANSPSSDDKLSLERAIDKLAPHYRHIIILKYYQDMTLTEIARLLEKPEGTVKTWLNKALIQLRSDMGPEGCGEFA
jgi:RNA polymerase sigma-70 factor (TIGR02954 family)